MVPRLGIFSRCFNPLSVIGVLRRSRAARSFNPDNDAKLSSLIGEEQAARSSRSLPHKFVVALQRSPCKRGKGSKARHPRVDRQEQYSDAVVKKAILLRSKGDNLLLFRRDGHPCQCRRVVGGRDRAEAERIGLRRAANLEFVMRAGAPAVVAAHAHLPPVQV